MKEKNRSTNEFNKFCSHSGHENIWGTKKHLQSIFFLSILLVHSLIGEILLEFPVPRYYLQIFLLFQCRRRWVLYSTLSLSSHKNATLRNHSAFLEREDIRFFFESISSRYSHAIMAVCLYSIVLKKLSWRNRFLH